MTKIRHLVLIAAVAFSACSRSKHKAAASESASGPVGAGSGGQVITKPDPNGTGLADGRPVADSRKIIRTGRIALVVQTYDEARARIDALVAQAGGYVDSTDVNRRQDSVSDATIVVRVPSNAFGSLVPKLREIGEIISESTNAADITDQYVDIAARLASAQALEKRLIELATDKKGTIEQILAVERELARVRTEIEGFEGHMRQWNDQIAMSTLTLALSTKRPEIVAVAAPGLGSRVKQSFHDSTDSLRDFGGWLAVTAMALLPWLVLIIPGFVFGRRIARRYRKLPQMVAHPAPPAPMPPPAIE